MAQRLSNDSRFSSEPLLRPPRNDRTLRYRAATHALRGSAAASAGYAAPPPAHRATIRSNRRRLAAQSRR
jgi:hypothetical protein